MKRRQIVELVITAAVASLVLTGLAVVSTTATDRAAAGAAARQTQKLAPVQWPKRVLTARDGWDPIATYDPNDKLLNIDTRHLPADALICIDHVCQLSADWLPVKSKACMGSDCRLPADWRAR